MSSEGKSIAVLRKVVSVPVDPGTAFEIFTSRINEWWPLVTHSVGEEQALSVTFGKQVGATIEEELADGSRQTWGEITEWEPPRRVAFSWHPGKPISEAGLVEVTFTRRSSTLTVVELAHSGWERRPDGVRARQNYESGWDPVLERFTGVFTPATS